MCEVIEEQEGINYTYVSLEINNHMLHWLDMVEHWWMDEFFNYSYLGIHDGYGDLFDWFILPTWDMWHLSELSCPGVKFEKGVYNDEN